MKPFTRLTAPALIMRENRIDTDVIFPARFLLLMQREGLGDCFCLDRRQDSAGVPIPNPIDDARTRGAGVLIAGKEFGCGSSREQAVWTIADFGISCIVAESFGEIFAANCLRNGVLPIVLDAARIDRIDSIARTGPLTVDLPSRSIVGIDGSRTEFTIAADAAERLLMGWDETALIQGRWGTAIDTFERAQFAAQPWLYEELAL